MHIAVSNCGKYVALVGDDLTVQIAHTESRLPAASCDVARLVQAHLAAYRSAAALSAMRSLQVTLVKWEKVGNEPLTKLALTVVLGRVLCLVMVVLLLQAPPIFIHQPPLEGIELVEWLEPALDSESAYANSRQLVVYARHNLVARVYLLDATHVLFEVPKPLLHVLVRPHHHTWSLVVGARANSAAILQFAQQSHASQLMALLPAGMPSLHYSWSPSGHWLMSFEGVNRLHGFRIQVYPSLAKPVLDLIWDGESLTEYVAQWVECEAQDVCAVAPVLAPRSQIELMLVSVMELRLCTRNVTLPTLCWRLEGGHYTKSTERHEFGALRSLHGAASHLAFAYDRAVVLCRIEPHLTVVVDAVLVLLLPLCHIEHTAECWIVATKQDVGAWDCRQSVARVVFAPVTGVMTSVQAMDTSVVAVTSDGSWAVAALRPGDRSPSPEPLAPRAVPHPSARGPRLKRHRLSYNDSIEATDTFDARKRRHTTYTTL